jgi:hypothetical protein
MSAERLLVAYFEEEDAVLAATRSARKKGLPIADVFTPYAVHGMDEAMGLSPSRLTFVCFFAGLFGLLTAIGFQVWVSAVSWRLNVGGKPFLSIPAFIPVTFEFTVLCASLITVAALLFRTKLFPGATRTVLPRITDDRFALALRAGGPSFDEAAARELCTRLGAVEVGFVEVTA